MQPAKSEVRCGRVRVRVCVRCPYGDSSFKDRHCVRADVQYGQR